MENCSTRSPSSCGIAASGDNGLYSSSSIPRQRARKAAITSGVQRKRSAGISVMTKDFIRYLGSAVTLPPALPLGQRSSSYSHASMSSRWASSATALVSSNHSRPKYSVISPARACMKNPPRPISFIMPACRISSSFSSSPFQAQNGLPRYARPGCSKASTRAGRSF